jgi:hypothetical protein
MMQQNWQENQLPPQSAKTLWECLSKEMKGPQHRTQPPSAYKRMVAENINRAQLPQLPLEAKVRR